MREWKLGPLRIIRLSPGTSVLANGRAWTGWTYVLRGTFRDPAAFNPTIKRGTWMWRGDGTCRLIEARETVWLLHFMTGGGHGGR